jgi:hypothetical protein
MRIIAPILALTLSMGCDKDEDDTAELTQPLKTQQNNCSRWHPG